MQNVIFTMLILTLLGLTAYGLKIDDTGSRVTLNVTLILTLVAFKFVLASMLPRTAYNTLLDYYMAICTVTLAINCAAVEFPYIIQHSKYGVDDKIDSMYTAENVNKSLFYAMGSWIFLFTTAWMVISAIQVRVTHADAMTVKEIDFAHLEEDDDKYDIDITYDDAHKGKEHHHDISRIGVLHHRVDEDELNIESTGLLQNFRDMATSARAVVNRTSGENRTIANNPMHEAAAPPATTGAEML